MASSRIRWSVTWAASAALLAALAAWLYLDNRALRARLAEVSRAPGAASETTAAAAVTTGAPTPDARSPRRGLLALGEALSRVTRRPEPAPATPPEGRMERRSRRSAEVAALLGRAADESEEDYRARVVPILSGVLERPRERVLEMRREAEAQAGVSPEQSAKVDAALGAAYDELLAYTDAAIEAGQLSPYQRNVAGMLEYAGGLGGILGGAEAKIGTILAPEQAQAMYDAGFEWGEFLGVSAPWERLKPPPPAPAP
ncbi:MAG: hypothetical protein R3B48_19040 [Kofleriaceae bacterium]